MCNRSGGHVPDGAEVYELTPWLDTYPHLHVLIEHYGPDGSYDAAEYTWDVGNLLQRAEQRLTPQVPFP